MKPPFRKELHIGNFHLAKHGRQIDNHCYWLMNQLLSVFPEDQIQLQSEQSHRDLLEKLDEDELSIHSNAVIQLTDYIKSELHNGNIDIFIRLNDAWDAAHNSHETLVAPLEMAILELYDEAFPQLCQRYQLEHELIARGLLSEGNKEQSSGTTRRAVRRLGLAFDGDTTHRNEVIELYQKYVEEWFLKFNWKPISEEQFPALYEAITKYVEPLDIMDRVSDKIQCDLNQLKKVIEDTLPEFQV